MLSTPDQPPSCLRVLREGQDREEGSAGGAAAPLCGGESSCKLRTRTPAHSSHSASDPCIASCGTKKSCPPSLPPALIPLCADSFHSPVLKPLHPRIQQWYWDAYAWLGNSQLCLILRVKKKKKGERKKGAEFTYTHKLEKYRNILYKRSVTSVFRYDLPKGFWWINNTVQREIFI